LAWMMYANDNQDNLPPNENGSGAGKDSTGSWVAGWEDFTVNNPDNTNINYLVNAKIGPYTKSIGIYKCPADNFNCTISGRSMPRIRSVSMNGFIEGGAYKGQHGASDSIWYVGYWSYQKMSDIKNPPPVNLWVFVDEHPDSINDGWLIPNPVNLNSWTDLPASYHNGACGFGFADGHAEIKKWQDASTIVPVLKVQRNGFAAATTRDTSWFIARSTAPSK
jgi:prepilin-type processing-associated H-X9-DG protein